MLLSRQSTCRTCAPPRCAVPPPRRVRFGHSVEVMLAVVCAFQQHLSELMTKKWLSGSNAVDIICVTVEDYFNDFAKIKKPYKKVRARGVVAVLEV